MLSGSKLSEYHTGYRAFSREVLETLPLLENSDDFVFDNQMLAQVMHFGFEIGEISCPTAYFPEASSINFSRSVTYGLGCLRTAAQLFAQRRGVASFPIFAEGGRRLVGRGGGEERGGGPGRNRTGINGFAVRWLSHSPTGPRGGGRRAR